MKKLALPLLLLFLNTLSAQIDINFNTQALPSDWTMQGSFEIQNADIYPKCQQNALVGTFFQPSADFWLQTDEIVSTGANIQIDMVFGLKDLYHALGVSNPFQKPSLFVEYTNGNSDNWIQHSEIPLEDLQQSATCLEYHTTIDASEIQNFETVKVRFVYKSPEQTGSLYLLYWSIDSLKIIQEASVSEVCTESLGGGLEPSFVTFGINDTGFEHNTFSEPTEYYHAYPQTAVLNAGQSYDLYTFTSSEAVIGVWMDYNQNNSFEENEYTELVNNMQSQNTTSFTVSNTSNTGLVKMRLRSRAYGSEVNSTDACSTFGSGETRDYTFTINNSLGIKDSAFNSDLKIYPNPTSQFINIETSSNINTVTVYNMMGQLLLKGTSDKLDISGIPNGTFLVQVTSNDGRKSIKKIVKQ